jgi:hypothetical protein
MNRFYALLSSNQRRKAKTRLQRIHDTCEIIRRLEHFQDGRVFIVDTQPLKWDTPCLIVHEHHDGALLYAKEVAALATALNRKLVITSKLNYFIF